MKIRSLVAAAITGFISLLVASIAGQAAELKVLSAIGIQSVMEDLGPKFERASGHRLAITFATGGQALKRVQDGDTADVIIVPRPVIESFLKDGKTGAGNVTAVAYSGMGVAVRKGAPQPDISTPDSFKRALLAAKSITYGNPATGGASGIYMVKVLERLGITDEMKPKTVLLPKPGLNTNLVANGEVEITVNLVPELVAVPGVVVVGMVPRDLQENTVFWAAIMTGTKNAEASKALRDFLRTPEAIAVIRVKGMEPGAP